LAGACSSSAWIDAVPVRACVPDTGREGPALAVRAGVVHDVRPLALRTRVMSCRTFLHGVAIVLAATACTLSAAAAAAAGNGGAAEAPGPRRAGADGQGRPEEASGSTDRDADGHGGASASGPHGQLAGDARDGLRDRDGGAGRVPGQRAVDGTPGGEAVPAATGAELAATGGDAGQLPLDDLRAFAEAFERVRAAYVEPVDDSTLLRNAIRGLLSGLDPHSEYLDDAALGDLEEITSGQFGGIGIEIGVEDGAVTVVAPIDGTPAARAGIRSGDVITQIDDQPVDLLRINSTIESMRGEPGSPVSVTVRRAGEGEIRFEMERAVINVRSVRGELLEPNYGYLRISQFQSTTARDLEAALDGIARDNGAPLRGLVLDLRNNPGGVLQASVDVADAFLADGLIVYTRGRIADSELRYEATPGDRLDGAPIVVLINAGSASASEIVAGALQDHRRAVIVGSRSFGKGSVQTILPLSEDRAIKLTTALYYTPRGRSIQAQGIEPDIAVAARRAAAGDAGSDAEDAASREASLPAHLAAPDAPPVRAERYRGDDAQIVEALNVLRGAHILGLDRREAPGAPQRHQ
jgi:carboxyl-terminal processing protease